MYAFALKLVPMGLGLLSALGALDIDALVFVAKAQGATRGRRQGPDIGLSVSRPR